MKKCIVFIAVLLLAFSAFNSFGVAENGSNNFGLEKKDNKLYIHGNEVKGIYQVINGKWTELTVEEHDEI